MSVTISGDTGLAGAATGALNGTLGATTPSTVVATTISSSGTYNADITNGIVIGTGTIGGGTSGATQTLNIKTVNGGISFGASNSASTIESVNGSGTLTYAVGASSGAAHTWKVNTSTTAMTLDASGNITLGATAPIISTNGTSTKIFLATTTGVSSASGWISLSGSAHADAGTSIYNAGTGGKHIFKLASVDAMQIANSGGVSIGNTTDPGATNLSVTGVINGATLFGQGIGISNGGSQTVTCPRSFDTRGAQIFIGGLVQGVGGRAGLYITTGYGNGVTTISAFAGLTVTCNTSAGTITIANASGATVDGRVTVTY